MKKNLYKKAFSMIFGILGFLLIIGIDKFYFNRHPFIKGLPILTGEFLIRDLGIFVLTFLVLFGLIDKTRPKTTFINPPSILLQFLAITVALVFSILFISIFVNNPKSFSILSYEDGPVEKGSAAFLFLSCFLFIFATFKYYNNPNLTKVTTLFFILFSIVFFVMGMEEVSWFQRVFDIKTPESFKGNAQNELNMHNFETDYVEIVYYFGGFVFLVILPFIRVTSAFLLKYKFLDLFLARPFVIIIGAIASAYNYSMWNNSLMQISFFSSIFVLGAFATFSTKKNEKLLLIATIFILVLSQSLFLINGMSSGRLHDVTEYRELFIPLGFFVYALDVINRIPEVYHPDYSKSANANALADKQLQF